MLEEGPFEYVTFGEDMHGELYSADIEGGEIFHVIDVSPMKVGAAYNNDAATLYPNPNSGQFTVNWFSTADNNCSIEIMNVVGQKLLTESRLASKGSNTWEFSTDLLATGNYILIIHGNDGALLTKKFAVE
ncbi:MAG TPA: T9SS type A sorting domain-containing protein [Chitinophagales bacterium]|nr:T9SS type A sorting domain-containing protein [Chitinophagales bacterium]